MPRGTPDTAAKVMGVIERGSKIMQPDTAPVRGGKKALTKKYDTEKYRVIRSRVISEMEFQALKKTADKARKQKSHDKLIKSLEKLPKSKINIDRAWIGEGTKKAKRVAKKKK